MNIQAFLFILRAYIFLFKIWKMDFFIPTHPLNLGNSRFFFEPFPNGSSNRYVFLNLLYLGSHPKTGCSDGKSWSVHQHYNSSLSYSKINSECLGNLAKTLCCRRQGHNLYLTDTDIEILFSEIQLCLLMISNVKSFLAAVRLAIMDRCIHNVIQLRKV